MTAAFSKFFKITVGIFFIALYVGLPNNSCAQERQDSSNNKIEENFSRDFKLGNANASVTIIEYSSPLCSHCREFHDKVFPAIERDFIKTGKVFYVFRDLPIDGISLQITQVACSGDVEWHKRIEAIFDGKNRKRLFEAVDPQQELLKIFEENDISRAKVEQCIGDKDRQNNILQILQQAHQHYKIEGTPTFIVNGKKYMGYRSLAGFKKIIEKALAESLKE